MASNSSRSFDTDCAFTTSHTETGSTPSIRSLRLRSKPFFKRLRTVFENHGIPTECDTGTVALQAATDNNGAPCLQLTGDIGDDFSGDVLNAVSSILSREHGPTFSAPEEFRYQKSNIASCESLPQSVWPSLATESDYTEIQSVYSQYDTGMPHDRARIQGAGPRLQTRFLADSSDELDADVLGSLEWGPTGRALMFRDASGVEPSNKTTAQLETLEERVPTLYADSRSRRDSLNSLPFDSRQHCTYSPPAMQYTTSPATVPTAARSEERPEVGRSVHTISAPEPDTDALSVDPIGGMNGRMDSQASAEVPPSCQPSLSIMTCAVCEGAVRENSIVYVRDNRLVHTECCRDSPPPYSPQQGEALPHRSTTHALTCPVPHYYSTASQSDNVIWSHCSGMSVPYLPFVSLAIPAELWDVVIDFLWDEPEALLACAFVCKAWYNRSRLHLSLGVLQVGHKRDVVRLARFVRAHRAYGTREFITICGGADGSLAHLSAFTAQLACRLPRLESLFVENGTWSTGMVDADFFTRVASFVSVTRLSLSNVTLPSTTTFAQLVCALRSLTELYCVKIRTVDRRVGEKLFLPITRLSKLSHLTLEGPHVYDIVDFLVATNHSRNLLSIALHVGSVDYRHFSHQDAVGYRELLGTSHSLQHLHLQIRDAPPLSHTLDFNNVLVHYLNIGKNSRLEVIEFSIIPHPYSDCRFSCVSTILSYAMSTTMRELSLAVDIEGESDEATHDSLLARISDEMDVSHVDRVLATRRYANLEGVEVVLRVGHTQSRLVKFREALWVEKMETQMHRMRERGILSVRVQR